MKYLKRSAVVVTKAAAFTALAVAYIFALGALGKAIWLLLRAGWNIL